MAGQGALGGAPGGALGPPAGAPAAGGIGSAAIPSPAAACEAAPNP
jgi:hypothetical protein